MNCGKEGMSCMEYLHHSYPLCFEVMGMLNQISLY